MRSNLMRSILLSFGMLGCAAPSMGWMPPRPGMATNHSAGKPSQVASPRAAVTSALASKPRSVAAHPPVAAQPTALPVRPRAPAVRANLPSASGFRPAAATVKSPGVAAIRKSSGATLGGPATYDARKGAVIGGVTIPRKHP